MEGSQNTYHRFGGMKADDAKHLTELEWENARLKAILADRASENQVLKEMVWGNR